MVCGGTLRGSVKAWKGASVQGRRRRFAGDSFGTLLRIYASTLLRAAVGQLRRWMLGIVLREVEVRVLAPGLPGGPVMRSGGIRFDIKEAEIPRFALMLDIRHPFPSPRAPRNTDILRTRVASAAAVGVVLFYGAVAAIPLAVV